MQENNESISRLELLISALGITQRELSGKTGLSTSVLSHYATGERKISAQSALKIKKAFPQVNTDWLLTGKGEMFKEPKAPERDNRTDAEVEANSQAMLAEIQKKLEALIAQGEKDKETIAMLVKVLENVTKSRDAGGEQDVYKVGGKSWAK